MYAVIKTGGKQYPVVPGEKIKVEQIPADVGAELTLDQVLLVGEGEAVKIGAPMVDGASVKATVVSHGRRAALLPNLDARLTRPSCGRPATTARTGP